MKATRLFAIYAREADTCGNEETCLLGYFVADSLATAEREFPRGFLCGYVVEVVVPEPKQTLHARARRLR